MNFNSRFLLRLMACWVVSLFVLGGQQQLGPWVGLRIWVAQRLDDTQYLLKIKEADFRIDPDPAGTSDGVLGIRWPAAGSVYDFSGDFFTVTPETDGATQVTLNTAIILHLSDFGPVEPLDGADCSDRGSAAAQIGQSGAWFCVPPSPPRTDSTGWTWRRIAWQ